MPSDEEIKLLGKCPECGSYMTERKSKRGKVYYSCQRYPDCKFMSWDIPTGEKCATCGSPIIQTAGGKTRCSNKSCAFKSKGDGKKKAVVADGFDAPALEEPPVYDGYHGRGEDDA